ncbi:tyrosine-protein phosphatase non-receptor type 21-like [Lineus longissimus]|uniref:tyrosine-protein phosphatase non-receptor type 21-like n=1 Tax=Lineus longissimus TaxID=88925 RepID=UPI002B4FB498
MPFKLRLKRTRRYDVSSKHLYVVSAQLLDNTLIECTLTTESTGMECLENIAQRIELREIQYFGLRYFNKKLQLHWVDLDKPLKKQLEKNDHSPMLYFGVMLYVSDIQRLGDDMARYQYYLQLKHDILEGHIPCHHEQAVILASYSVQAEFGDHDFTRHTLEYFKEFALLPKLLTLDEKSYSALCDEILTTHRSLQGLSPMAAELHYIMAAMQLDGYGVECYPGKDDTGSDLILGASYAGLFMKHLGGQTTVYFKWDEIKHLTHHRKSFIIQTCHDQQNVQLNMDDTDVAKYVWRMCVTQHKFNRLQKEISSTRSSQSIKSTSSEGKQQPQAMPDLQQSVQQSLQNEPKILAPDRGLQQTALYQDHHLQGEYEGENDYHQTQIPVQSSYEQTSGDVVYTPNAVVNGSIYDVEHAQVVLGSQNNISTTITPSHHGIQAPEYRPTPDYETVMRQRIAQHQNFDQLSLTQSMTISNIGNTQIYRHPSEHLAYSQPEIGQAVQYEHQMVHPLHRGFNIAYSHPVVEHGVASKPIERVSSLVIQPTYSTPELNVQIPVQQSASETVLPQSMMGYRNPPTYSRPSSSTPDLATHTVKPNFNPPPDLLSRRNIDLSELLAQSRLDQSYENLAGNLQNMDMYGDYNKHRSRTLDSVSTGSNATFHAKDVETASEDSDFVQYPSAEGSYERGLNIGVEMTETKDLTYDQMLRQDQEPVGSEQCDSGSEYDPVAEMENPPFVENPSDSEIECLDVSKMSEMTSSVAHSKCSSMDTTSVLPLDEDAARAAILDEAEEEEKDAVAQALKTDSSDEDDDEVKRRSMGPLKMAHLNGLTISRAQIMFAQNDESRAPKDDRRKHLESKLEEGQVFVEFEKIPKKVTTTECRVALNPENLSKNRFKDVHPYDSSRVRLKPKSSNSSGYINASHIRVRVKGQELWYIAAQAPLKNTTEDFWQMIWEQDIQVIAMLTQLTEMGKEKCYPYWPTTPGSKHKLTFGEFQVSLKFSNDSLCYVTNGLNLKHKGSGKERMIWHLQYTDWPDHGCPDDVHGFLAFLEEIESVNRHIAIENPASEKKFPTLIHCSAGVGRAGVAILVEVMKTCLEFNQNVDIPTVLATLRGQRMHMVQTVSQYTFVYKTLIQYLKNSRLI